MSLGLIVNILFVIAALYIFQRSLRMLYALVQPETPRKGWRERIKAVFDASSLLAWFSMGTLTMLIGLTGIVSRVLLRVV